MERIEVRFTIDSCMDCPYRYRSHYGVYLFCKFNSDLTKGKSVDHDISNLKDYPSYCPFDERNYFVKVSSKES